MIAQLIDLKQSADDRGALVAIEDHQLGFSIRRAYYLFGTRAGEKRGFHAHRNLSQLAVAVSGSCIFTLDDGRRRERVQLDDPRRGLVINSLIWREMSDFSPDCVLLVLASENYDEADYIRNYDDFRRIVMASTE